MSAIVVKRAARMMLQCLSSAITVQCNHVASATAGVYYRQDELGEAVANRYLPEFHYKQVMAATVAFGKTSMQRRLEYSMQRTHGTATAASRTCPACSSPTVLSSLLMRRCTSGCAAMLNLKQQMAMKQLVVEQAQGVPAMSSL
jgi:hypothetical protein